MGKYRRKSQQLSIRSHPIDNLYTFSDASGDVIHTCYANLEKALKIQETLKKAYAEEIFINKKK